MRRRARAGVAAAALVLMAGACGDDGGDEPEDSLPESTPDTTEEAVDEEAEVIDAYLAGWKAFEEASNNPANPDHPALVETLTGSHLDSVRVELGAMSEKGEYIAPDPERPREHSAEVTSLVSGERATVEDCSLGWATRYGEDGSPIEDPDTDELPRLYEAEMAFEDGVWKSSGLMQGDPCEL